jgi:integrase/recombinase XerD
LENTTDSGGSLYTQAGRRKYLTGPERARFIAAARNCHNPADAAFGLALAHSGMRISEALSLTPSLIQPDSGILAVRSLKKRGKIHFREIPVLVEVFKVLEAIPCAAPGRIWTFQRTRAWEAIKEIMALAEIEPGIHATPKGLRHGFGIHAVRSGVPLPLIQRWMGHARLETTSIYLQAVGEEEREFARRMW